MEFLTILSKALPRHSDVILRNMGMRPRNTKKRMGRPPKPPDEKRSAQMCVRMTQAERKRLDAEAKRLGITVSDLLMRPWREGKE